jgi:hypothetical protein
MANASCNVNVTIAGGGIAGLTAALRLAESGCQVTVYEKEGRTGGNLGGVQKNGIYYDFYPHMFGHWYKNFWKLVDDLRICREWEFEPRPTTGFLRRNEFPNFKRLTNSGSLESLASNLTSGIMPVPDMFLTTYSVIDLLSQDFSQRDLLSRQTVNGFLTSRVYMTERVAKLHEAIISNIWAVNSALASALAYQYFSKYQIRQPVPQSWVLKRDAYEQLILPLTNRLKELGCRILKNKTVRSVTVRRGRVDRIGVVDSPSEPVDNLILAVPPKALARLVQSQAPYRQEDSEPAEDIVSVLPELSELRRLRSEPIPVLHLTFRRRLPNIPRYSVSLMDSRFKLTFVERPELSSFDKTILSVAASDYYALPDDLDISKYLVLRELNQYVPFRLGSHYEDVNSDVDWDKTFFISNKDHPLFINEVGSERWCPEVCYPKISNLFFAGDFCRNFITIATVEAAVVSGLRAAKELLRRENIDNSIEIIEPDFYPKSLMAVLKVALAPYAVGAKCWSVSSDSQAGGLLESATSVLAESTMAASFGAIEWWDAVRSIYGWKRR